MAHNYNGTPQPTQPAAEVARDLAESAGVLKSIQNHQPNAAEAPAVTPAEATPSLAAPDFSESLAAKGGRVRRAAHAVAGLVGLGRRGKNKAPSETQGVGGGHQARAEARRAEHQRAESARDADENDAILRGFQTKLPAGEAAADGAEDTSWADAETAELHLADAEGKTEAGDEANLEELLNSKEELLTPEGFVDGWKQKLGRRIGTVIGTAIGKTEKFGRSVKGRVAARKGRKGEAAEAEVEADEAVSADVAEEGVVEAPVSTTRGDERRPRRGGRLHRAKEYTVTGFASAAARMTVNAWGLREGSSATMDRLPQRARNILRAWDIGSAVVIGTALVRSVMLLKGHAVPDMPHDNADALHGAHGGMHLAGNFTELSPDTNGDSSNNATVSVEHPNLEGNTQTAPEHTATTVGGYNPAEQTYTASAHDALTGRATNASDMSELSFRASFAAAGVPQEEVTKLLHDHPDLISKANHHLFTANPSINVHDKFHGGLNAGDSYKVGDLNKYTADYAHQWAAEHGYHPVDPHSTGHPGHNTTGEQTTNNQGGGTTQHQPDGGHDTGHHDHDKKSDTATTAAPAATSAHPTRVSHEGAFGMDPFIETGLDYGAAVAALALADRAGAKAGKRAGQEGDRAQLRADARREAEHLTREPLPEVPDLTPQERQAIIEEGNARLDEQIAALDAANAEAEEEAARAEQGASRTRTGSRRNHKLFGPRMRKNKYGDRPGTVRSHRG